MSKYDGSHLLANQQIYARDENGKMRAVGADFPLPMKQVEGGSSGGPRTVTILGAGSAAGSATYPPTAESAVAKDTDITIYFGGGASTTGTFTSCLIDINDRKTALPGIRENGASISQVNTANVGDVVSYTIPALCRLRIEYTAPTGGGTLSIKGVV
ncbi:hypothetical protein [Paenibacillus sp. UASWS1643]|uniref:hypothetical protein n=1 Tax=Paenibacillus sp. UASWS1643 TaxID=2580422 RepID=UPI00123A1295|nr:hypothetical protein [Paenibacillus sp. UASWS1643]KAA8750116.1 hypothetical protein FE296_16085 [Paenibacillus sp. UASWS1643]